jgi:putative tryptophan/tyrosine transport system substrate-binding protein
VGCTEIPQCSSLLPYRDVLSFLPKARSHRAVKRRGFIMLIGGAAAWPLVARAQRREQMRRVGVLMVGPVGDWDGQTRVAAFVETLKLLGWTAGVNVGLEYRWSAGDAATTRKYATELVASAPDVIVASDAQAIAALLQATHTVAIVFAVAADPVGAGYVDSLARPGGNVTGFMASEYAFSSKWLELLKEIAPRVMRAAVIRDPAITQGTGFFGAIQNAAPLFGVEVSPVNVRDSSEMERAISSFARGSDTGLIVTPSGSAGSRRDLIVTLASRYKLPAVYYRRAFVQAGGLVSYGPDQIDQFRRAAGYVDRILRGEKPADLPVQAPTRYELAINLKTAKALGLEVPPTLLARADDVIE